MKCLLLACLFLVSPSYPYQDQIDPALESQNKIVLNEEVVYCAICGDEEVSVIFYSPRRVISFCYAHALELMENEKEYGSNACEQMLNLE